MYRYKPPKPKRKAELFDGLSPSALVTYARHFLGYIEARGYSPHTVESREQSLREFFRWCTERSLFQPQDITRPIIERYRRALFHARKANGTPLSFATQHTRLVAIKSFFKWLAREGHILYNPASELEMPKIHRRLPRNILTIEEIDRILTHTAVHGALGIRDRAILETLYSTGVRRKELVKFTLYDVDVSNGTVMVREGKGGKDRLIPIGERACLWIEKYRDEVRPQYVREPDGGTLFLTEYGEPLHNNRVSDMVRKYLDAAGIAKAGSSHLFRHSMATHMLDNGADIRYIQAILGHANLATTEIYTHVAIKKLKEIHAATHPAKLEKAKGADTLTLQSTDEVAQRDALFRRLEDEAQEDED